MLPELLYEIYKYLHHKDYLVLKKLESKQLCYLIEAFRDPLEAKYIYFNGMPNKNLLRGIAHIAKTNPTYTWLEGINAWQLIEWVSEYGYIELCKFLLNDSRVNPSTGSNYAIRSAACNGHLEIVKLLIEDSRVDPSDMENDALYSAAGNGYLEVVKLLLSSLRVDPSADNNDILKWVVYKRQIGVVKLLYQDKRVQSTISPELKRLAFKIING